MGVGGMGGGGGGGWKFLVTAFLFRGEKFRSFFPTFQKCSWGSETHVNNFFMTMTCDRLKFWSGPAWRSKFNIRKPWRRKNKKF